MKSKINIPFIILMLSFSVFLILYISNERGYYEYKTHEKVVLTEENIKKFEEDVFNGKDVSAKDYLIINDNDYSNKVSILGEKTSILVNKFMNKILKKSFKILSKLFWD